VKYFCCGEVYWKRGNFEKGQDIFVLDVLVNDDMGNILSPGLDPKGPILASFVDPHSPSRCNIVVGHEDYNPLEQLHVSTTKSYRTGVP